MSVWLTPDLKPFVGGTYFPPEDSAHHVGFRTVLLRIAEQVRGQLGAVLRIGVVLMGSSHGKQRLKEGGWDGGGDGDALRRGRALRNADKGWVGRQKKGKKRKH